jgi:hypothetical protein
MSPALSTLEQHTVGDHEPSTRSDRMIRCNTLQTFAYTEPYLRRDLEAQTASCPHIQITGDRQPVIALESSDGVGCQRTKCAVHCSPVITELLQPSLCSHHNAARIGNTAVGYGGSDDTRRNNDWRSRNNYARTIPRSVIPWAVPWSVIPRPIHISRAPITAAAPFHTYCYPTSAHTYSPSRMGKSCRRHEGSTSDRKKFHGHNLDLMDQSGYYRKHTFFLFKRLGKHGTHACTAAIRKSTNRPSAQSHKSQETLFVHPEALPDRRKEKSPRNPFPRRTVSYALGGVMSRKGDAWLLGRAWSRSRSSKIDHRVGTPHVKPNGSLARRWFPVRPDRHALCASNAWTTSADAATHPNTIWITKSEAS